MREQLEAQAERLGIAGQVMFAGVVDDVRPWLSAFDAFVLPSRSEGMGLVLVEAMALGCPVVATKVGGIPEVLGDAGVLVESGNVEALALELARLLSDHAMQQRLSSNSRERAQRFSLHEMAVRTGALYEQLLGERSVCSGDLSELN